MARLGHVSTCGMFEKLVPDLSVYYYWLCLHAHCCLYVLSCLHAHWLYHYCVLVFAQLLYAGQQFSNYLIERVYVYLKGKFQRKKLLISLKRPSVNVLRSNSFVLFGYLICPDEKLLLVSSYYRRWIS